MIFIKQYFLGLGTIDDMVPMTLSLSLDHKDVSNLWRIYEINIMKHCGADFWNESHIQSSKDPKDNL